MATDKEKMMSSANYYAGLVASAKNDCADTFIRLSTPINEIERYWKGESGAQMVQELWDVKNNIKKIYDRLADLETQMKSQAASILEAWPDDTEVM